MSYQMPDVPRKYLPHDSDTPEQAALRESAKEAWLAARQAEIDAGQAPQPF